MIRLFLSSSSTAKMVASVLGAYSPPPTITWKPVRAQHL
ncbi:hypothetical protein POX_h09614 [Penicillium oxalicum]|nr:hypothetical protein POX_h09614 [Penicillium oxalicum]KAI2785852.1 hypothetical protein POX_h09614 [Penicillium oxalicum]